MNSIIKYNEPKEIVYDPHFALAERLCTYLEIARNEGYFACWRHKLAQKEPSRIIRNIFFDKYGFMNMCNLILDKEFFRGPYHLNEKNLETFLDQQEIKDPKLKEILRRALPLFAKGESVYVMKQALEPLVGEGLPNPEDIKYDYLAFPKQPEKHLTD